MKSELHGQGSRRWNLVLIAALAVLVAAVVAGCGSGNDSSSETTAPTAQTGETETGSSGSGRDLADKRIGVSLCCRIAIFDAWLKGFEGAAEYSGSGVKISVVNAGGDPLQQLNDVSTFIGQGFDAIMTATQSGEGYDKLVAQAQQDGIVYANLSSTQAANADLNVIYPHKESGYISGVAAGEWLKETQGGEGEVGAAFIPTDPGLQERTVGFEEGVKSVVPEVEIHRGVADKGDESDGANVGANLLQSNPDIKVLFGYNESVAIGMLQAASEAGQSDPESLFVTNPDSTPVSFEKVLKGTPMQAVVTANFPMSTALMMFLIERALSGEEIPHTGVMAPLLVTPENAQEVLDSQNNPFAPESQEALFSSVRLFEEGSPPYSNENLPKGEGLTDYWGTPPQP